MQSARADAGVAVLLLMWGGGVFLWPAITFVFFLWYRVVGVAGEEGVERVASVESEGETPRLASSKEKPGA